MDAGVRDVRDITDMAHPVWSTAMSAQGAVKQEIGSIGVPVVCAGAPVRPGDVVVADDDGVRLVAAEASARVLDLCLEREAAESAARKRLEAGGLSVDVFGLRPPGT